MPRAARAMAAVICTSGSQAVAQELPFSATYICERGVEVPVSYSSPDQANSTAVLYVENRMITLVQSRAASGARYEWPSDGSGYIWWNKGNAATLVWHDAVADNDTTIYAECRTQ